MERELERQRPVLIVDDDPAIRGWLKEMLEDELYQVVVALNGRDALNKLTDSTPPCLILLDLMMPIMNGYEFLTAQRQHPLLNDVPVIVLSAFEPPPDPVTALGIMDYLPKPVNIHRLLSLLQRHCENMLH